MFNIQVLTYDMLCASIPLESRTGTGKDRDREGQGAAKHTCATNPTSLGSCTLTEILFVRFSQTLLVLCVHGKHFYTDIIIYWYKRYNCVLIKCVHSHYVYSSQAKGVQQKLDGFVLKAEYMLLYQHF